MRESAVQDLDSAIDEIILFLEHDGLAVERTGDTLSIGSSTDTFAFTPVVRLPQELLRDYLRQPAGLLSELDPEAEALSLLQINIAEELGTDHGHGRNYVRSLELRRGRDGQVVLVVDKDVPPTPYRPPDPDLRWVATRPSEW